jgi:hypothetical protein
MLVPWHRFVSRRCPTSLSGKLSLDRRPPAARELWERVEGLMAGLEWVRAAVV